MFVKLVYAVRVSDDTVTDTHTPQISVKSSLLLRPVALLRPTRSPPLALARALVLVLGSDFDSRYLQIERGGCENWATQLACAAAPCAF